MAGPPVQTDIAKVKRNIQKMLDQGAPEADIDSYLSGEGVTIDMLKAPAAPVAQPTPDTASQTSGPLETFTNAMGQGALLNFGDEIGGAMRGYLPSIMKGEDAKTAGREYEKAKGLYLLRDLNEQAKNPKSAMGGNVAGQVVTGTAATALTGGGLPALLGAGAGQGALSAYGADTDPLEGAAWGAGGALVGYAGGKLVEKLVNRGIAYATILKAVDGNTDDLVREMGAKGISAAEADDVLKEVLRGQAARNPTAATAAIPGAQQRMADVGAQTIDDVNRLVSPENAQQFIAQLQQKAQQVGSQGYGAAYANPAQVGLVPQIANNPAVKPAIEAAQKLAAVEGRTFDINALTVQDLDAIQRALKNFAKTSFAGDSVDTLLGPSYSQFGDDINKMASQMAPAGPGNLAAVQGEYAAIKATQDAVEAGQKALNPAKEFVEVADEFANLSPEAQKGYLAGMATKLRTTLGQKGTTANSATAIDKTSIIEKLKAVGFPPEQIDLIINRGKNARGVLDALVGGSDTAKKLGASEASRSALSKFADRASGDITMAGITGQPGLLAMIPGLRALGGAQDRAVSKRLIGLLTEQGGAGLRGLLDFAPQSTSTPILNLLGVGAGSSQGGR
jgi:hypothetical protein